MWHRPLPGAMGASTLCGRQVDHPMRIVTVLIATLFLLVGLPAHAAAEGTEALPGADPAPAVHDDQDIATADAHDNTSQTTDGEGTDGPAASLPSRPIDAITALDADAHPFAVHAAMLRHLEHQGMYPAGAADALEQMLAAAATDRGPPVLRYKDTFLFCDTNGDGVPEVIENEWDLSTGRLYIRLYDGATGNYEWSRLQGLYIPYSAGWQPPVARSSLNEPQPDNPFAADNFGQGLDLNGDGVCDGLFYDMVVTVGVGEIFIQSDVNIIDGKTGTSTIIHENEATLIIVQQPGVLQFTLLDFPTGFLLYDTPEEPRFIWKTIDVIWTQVQEPVTGLYVFDLIVNDHISVHDATNGQLHWQRDLMYDTEGDRVNITHITGVTDLDGDGMPDVVLEQMWVTAAQSSEVGAGTPVEDSDFEMEYGRGMRMLSLDGRNGSDVWRTIIYDEDDVRSRPPRVEESFESLVFTGSQILPDWTGDNTTEVVAKFLTTESGDPASVNGQFRTHFVPLSGVDGTMLWGNEVKYQGWGHLTLLDPGPDAGHIALGTIDLPTPVPPAGRFPPKDIRLAVLHAEDGTPIWDKRETFPQDSYVSYHLALNQFIDGLATFDLDGDGVNDITTPGQYVSADAGEQLLLSTATQRFDILSGVDGGVLSSFDAFGSNSLVLSCGDAAEVTILGGYGRRIDAQRFDAATGEELWRWTIFIDSSPVSATAGVDLNFLGGRCTDDDLNRTFIGANLGISSLKRGPEFVPLFGAVDGPDDDLLWFRPTIERDEPLDELLERLLAPDEQSTASKVTRDASPLIPGAFIGAALGVMSKGRTSRKKDDLPDLYGDS